MATENEQKAISSDEKPVIWSKQKRELETMIIEERLKSVGVV